ncbi:hypothetical protein [Staphylococcus casei]|uniref:Late competence protein ComGE n=1 Tax=Staphylococcus casei TaxID=201828 RepID=A0ABZ2WBB0_9STAP|nr:hypothetical protein AST12_07530 [Staphylococcus succinus]PTI36642.1 hypothetical protein BU056_12750 [Staphylococcus succinus]
MKKFKLEASLLLDALISFLLVTSICLIFLPLLLQLNYTVKDKLHEIEMKRILLNTLYHNNYKALSRGILVDDYYMILSNKKLCITKKASKSEICYQVQY